MSEDEVESDGVLLLVDDDDILRSAVRRLLELEGFDCVEARSSGEAQEVLRSRDDVALMLCDVSMPVGSGIELLTKVHRDYPAVAVVMLTGSDNPNLARFALEQGAKAFVTKPFDTEVLLEAIRSSLAARAG